MSATMAPTAPPTAAPPAPSMFNEITRRKVMQLAPITRPVGGGTFSFALPRTGYCAYIVLALRGTVAGTVTGPNALGMASILRRLRVTLNSGLDVFQTSGAGYHYFLRQAYDLGHDPNPASNARSAVTATTFNIDVVIPLQMNLRDPLGLLLLQSESTLVQVTLDFEADSVVATGVPVVTLTTGTPYLVLFTVPPSDSDQPPQNIIHQILEESQAVSGASTVTYVWPRGGTYLQLWHGAGMGAAGADSFSRVQVRAAQSDYIQDTDIPYLDIFKTVTSPQQRLAGTIPLDWMYTAGLGMYDLMRDTVDTSILTDMATVVTVTGALTFYSLRRQLLVIPG